jgi:hypothetical protein
MERQEIEARVRAAYEAIAGASDPRPAFSDDIVWHVRGNNPVSGVYRGAEEYFGTMVERMGPLDEWRIVVGDNFTNERGGPRSCRSIWSAPGAGSMWTWTGSTSSGSTTTD